MSTNASTNASTTASTAEGEPRTLRNSPVTAGLVLANVAVFALQVWLAGSIRFAFGAGSTDRERAIWSGVLRWLGANDSVFTIADNRFETLITSCFLHGSILHLAFNLYVLVQVGPFLEHAVGRSRYLPLYLCSGAVASALSAIAGRFFGPSVSVGASGAICGLLGAILVLGGRTQGWRGPLTRQMASYLGFLFLLGFLRNYASGGMVQVDNAAHVGGAASGAIIAATWKRGYTYTPRAKTAILAICLAVLAASAGAVWYRNQHDGYVFTDLEGRLRAAYVAAQSGQCERAYAALSRAAQMDPHNAAVRELGADIDRMCLVPTRDPLPLPH